MMAYLSKLFEAFIGVVEPLFVPFRSRFRCVAVVEAEELAIYFVSNGVCELVARSGSATEEQKRVLKRRKGSEVELRLRADQVLRRVLHLPQAGRDFVEPIINHRLERLVPWQPSHALYGFKILETSTSDNSMVVDFAATSANIAIEAAEALRQFNLVPTTLGTAAEPIMTPISIDMYRGRRSATRSRIRYCTAIGLTAVALVLGAACPISIWMVYTNGKDLQALDGRLSEVRELSQGTGSVIVGLARGRALIETKKRESSVIVLIDRLSRAIPDNTFLRELEVDQEKVRLVGTSSDAPALIGILEAETLSKVQFSAPVTRDDVNRDNFDITAARPLNPTEATAR